MERQTVASLGTFNYYVDTKRWVGGLKMPIFVRVLGQKYPLRVRYSKYLVRRGLSTLKGGNSRVYPYPYPSKGKGRVGF